MDFVTSKLNNPQLQSTHQFFMVTGEPCPVIGYFPYEVRKTIPYSTDLDYVNFQTANGTERIPIHDVMADSNAVTPQALTAVAFRPGGRICLQFNGY